MDENEKASKRSQLFTDFYDQLLKESDQGCVIISASLIDDVLVRLIKARLAPSIEKQDELFDNASSPFSTFSARIDLAYRLGIIRPQVRASFHLVRRIRNDFAHVVESSNFDSDSVNSRMRELFKLNKEIITAMKETIQESLKPAVTTRLNSKGITASKEVIQEVIADGIDNRLVFQLYVAAIVAFMMIEESNILAIESLM
jgi:hypothetical protein